MKGEERYRGHHANQREYPFPVPGLSQPTPAPFVVAITDGKLDLGPWEQIFYGEFDGMRKKRVLIKIIGE